MRERLSPDPRTVPLVPGKTDTASYSEGDDIEANPSHLLARSAVAWKLVGRRRCRVERRQGWCEAVSNPDDID